MRNWKKVLLSLGIISGCFFSISRNDLVAEAEIIPMEIENFAENETENLTETEAQTESETEKKVQNSLIMEESLLKDYRNGFVQENGNTYYFENGKKLVQTEKYINGKWYYFGDNGVMATGWTMHHGNQYYYDGNGVMAHGIYKIGDRTYGFNEWTGVLLSGEHFFTDGSSDQWYYFSENPINKGEMATGWTTHHGNKYYYTAKGQMVHGIYSIDGTYYGFDEWTGVLLNGERYMSNAWRYFDNNGKMAIGWSKHHGHQYYYNSDGSMFYGELYDNGKWYYFKDITGIMATGWTEHHGNTYYYESNGCMVHGKYKINGNWYYFDEWTGVLGQGGHWGNGWRYENGYKVYYDNNGKLVENVESIIGKQSSYFVKVNTQTNTVTVFAKDGSNGYIIPVKKMICSTGMSSTPTIKGTYTIRRYGRWATLMGPVYGQYCSQIYGGYLFHSAWYYTNGNNKTLSVSEYRKLGTNASHGCVRMTVRDAKWIYDNCNGSTVYIYSSPSDGDPFKKPARPNPVVLYGDKGYDPTDPAFY